MLPWRVSKVKDVMGVLEMGCNSIASSFLPLVEREETMAGFVSAGKDVCV